MYIRWQSRQRQRPEFGRYRWRRNVHVRVDADGKSLGPDVRWRAVLVESVRIDGRPCQRHIAVLGSFTESCLEIVHQRRFFWDRLHARLDRLGLPKEERRRIERALAEKVPRLTRKEHDDSVARSIAFLGEEANTTAWRAPA